MMRRSANNAAAQVGDAGPAAVERQRMRLDTHGDEAEELGHFCQHLRLLLRSLLRRHTAVLIL